MAYTSAGQSYAGSGYQDRIQSTLAAFIPGAAMVTSAAAMVLLSWSGIEFDLPRHRAISDAGSHVQLDYPTYGVAGRSQTVNLSIKAANAQTVSVEFSPQDLRDFAFISSVPVADTITSFKGGIVLMFEPKSLQTPSQITLVMQPLYSGRASLALRTTIGQSLSADVGFWELVLP